MRSNYKRLGDYIREVKNRNSNLSLYEILGINIDKYFMPSVANVIGTDISSYKIVKKGQFACNLMHVGRDKRLPVALSDRDDFIVSPAYIVFEIININVLNSDYLMMWFMRSEFDRNVCFYTDADVRGGLSWHSFLDMCLPIPSIEKQREIVAEYKAVQRRIDINNKLIQKLEETAQAIYKQWFVDFEFPDENGNPYKSSGGEMIDSELGEIPKGWKLGTLNFISSLASGKSKQCTLNGDIPVYGAGGIIGYCDEYLLNEQVLIIGRVGTHGKVFRERNKCWPNDNTLLIRSKYFNFCYYVLKSINYDEINRGGVQALITQTDIGKTSIVIPEDYVLSIEFENRIDHLFRLVEILSKMCKDLHELESLLLAKLSLMINN